MNHILEELTAQGTNASDLDCLIRWLQEMDWMEAAMCNGDVDFSEVDHKENKPWKEGDNFKKTKPPL